MAERDVQRALLAAIGAIPGSLTERMNTGTATDTRTGRVVRFGTPGSPDVRVTLQGRAVAIECKSATGRLSPEQERWQHAHTAAGGFYIVCRDVRQTVLTLAEIATGATKAALLAAAETLR